MKKIFYSALIGAGAAFFMSCASSQPPLYYWGGYTNATYEYIKGGNDEDMASLLSRLESAINEDAAKSARQVPPPGLCADYGYLLAKSGENDKAIEMFKKEKAFYPESTPFINGILKKFGVDETDEADGADATGENAEAETAETETVSEE